LIIFSKDFEQNSQRTGNNNFPKPFIRQTLITMKKSLPGFALLCISIFSLGSCATTQNSVIQPKTATEETNEFSASCYVVKNDGSTQQFTSLRLVTGVLITPHLLADNKTVIEAKDVLAYSDGRRFAVSQKLLNTKRTSYVAVETLPGFAVRITQGKLNIYSRKYYNGATAVTEYFIQPGDEGEILAYTPAAMKELIKDNNLAADYFNSKVKVSPRAKKLLVTANMYNNPGQYLSKN
jgi:hypothetical protein